MAEKFFREMSCDRCGRQISLTDSGPGESMEKDGKGSKPVVSFNMDGEKPVEYKDLCDKCKSRCKDLLNMAGKDYSKVKAKKKKGVKPGETAKDDKNKGAQPTA